VLCCACYAKLSSGTFESALLHEVSSVVHPLCLTLTPSFLDIFFFFILPLLFSLSPSLLLSFSLGPSSHPIALSLLRYTTYTKTMEEKKKSTIGKAFSRTFSRKPTAPAAAPAPAPTAVAAAPVKADVAPISTSHNGILSPISIPTPNMTSISPPDFTNVSRVTSPTHDNGMVPQSPQNHSMHVRDSTGLSNSSSSGSRTGLEEGVAADGGLNPADILLNRLVAFRAVVKNLQQYFTEVAQVEVGVSKAMHKASSVITVPFKDGQQFLGKGGLQDVCTGIRDSAKTRSDQHASAARFVEETVVKNLRRLKQDIKAKIKALKADTNLYSNRVFKERELTQERIASLAKAIGLFDMSGQHQPDMEKVQLDPYVINLGKFFFLDLREKKRCI